MSAVWVRQKLIHLHTDLLVGEHIASLMLERILFKWTKILLLDLVRILMNLDVKTSLWSV